MYQVSLRLLFLSAYFIIFPLSAQIQVIAHRGASLEEPENTIRAFNKAYHLNADFIELDIHLSKDGTPIVIHDLKYALDKENHLASLALMLKGESIPTLEEVFKQNYSNMGYMIEIKEGSAPASSLVKKTMDLIEKYHITSYCIGSKSLQILKQLLKYNPNLPVIAIIDNKKNIDHVLNLGIKHLAIHFFFINKTLMQNLNEKHIKVWAWTVDDIQVLQKMVRLKVHGLITDDVKLVKSYLY